MAMRKRLGFAFLVSIVCQTGFTQKHIITSEQVWLGTTSQLRFSDRWGGYYDVQTHSRKNYVEGMSQFSFRLGAFYYFTDDVRVGAGYALNENFYSDQKNLTVQPEHSPWQQLSWTNRFKHFTLNQSLRYEERFRHNMLGNKLAKGYSLSYRTRYNVFLNYPLTRNARVKNALDAVMYNEVYLNFGKHIVYNTFDQYRIFAGLNYHLTSRASLLFGYLDIFQQLASGNAYRKLHTARIFYLRNFDLRKKHNKTEPAPLEKLLPPVPLS